MKRSLHFGVLKSINPGVLNQLDNEVEAAKLEKINHQVVYFSHDEPTREYMIKPQKPHILLSLLPGIIKNYLNLRIQAYSWLKDNQEKYETIFIRYPLGDMIFPWYAKGIKRFSTIHHTKEIPEIKSRRTLTAALQLCLEKIQFWSIQGKIYSFIGVTKEIADYQNSRANSKKRTAVYPNGIDGSIKNLSDKRGDTVKLCFIYNKLSPWHGLNQIKEQLTNNHRNDFKIYFIGPKCNDAQLEADSRVIETGFLSEEDLETTLRVIDASIGPFSLGTNELEEACPLKTRTSLRHGIPVIANYHDPCFDRTFPFFLRSGFDIDKAIEFAVKMRSTDKIEISQRAIQNCSKRTLLKKLLSQF